MRYWVGLVAALLTFCSPAFANYEDGLRAYNSGDHAAAFVEWRASAAEGDSNAQFQLGQLYEQGLGVPQNLALAHAWYRVSAAKGHAKAGDARDALSGRMTPEQHDKARQVAARLFSANATKQGEAAATTSQSAATATTAGSGQSGAQTTALPSAGNRFDGAWRGSGRTDNRSPRNKCGSGPKLEAFVDGKTVKGKLILVVPGKNQTSEVVILKGRIDDQGRFKLEGRDTEVAGRLAADRSKGNGEWSFGPRCSGDFQLTKRG